jgi:hypothetical protein
MVSSSYLAAENAFSWAYWVILQQPGNLLRNLCLSSFAAKVVVKSLFHLIYVVKMLQD